MQMRIAQTVLRQHVFFVILFFEVVFVFSLRVSFFIIFVFLVLLPFTRSCMRRDIITPIVRIMVTTTCHRIVIHMVRVRVIYVLVLSASG